MEIVHALQNGSNYDTKFSWKHKIMGLDNPSMKLQLLQEYHATPIGGHAGSL